MATWVHSCAVTHSTNASNPRVVVGTVRWSYVTCAPVAIRAQAVTLPACTSSPAHRGYKTSMSRLLRGRWHGVRGNLRCALSGDAGVAIRGARGTAGPTRERALSTNDKPTS